MSSNYLSPANDVILSHMVTFLNDKEEVSLRGCFFERVVGVAAYVGHHAANILLPLLQQVIDGIFVY